MWILGGMTRSFLLSFGDYFYLFNWISNIVSCESWVTSNVGYIHPALWVFRPFHTVSTAYVYATWKCRASCIAWSNWWQRGRSAVLSAGKYDIPFCLVSIWYLPKMESFPQGFLLSCPRFRQWFSLADDILYKPVSYIS